MTTTDIPTLRCPLIEAHTQLLLSSFRRVVGKALIEGDNLCEDCKHEDCRQANTHRLFHASFAVVSHNTAVDPVFNYGNKTALDLFEMPWGDFTNLPSRLSAEPTVQSERDALLARVTRDGFIDDYKGVRVSAKGRRFWVSNAIVWNVFDGVGQYHGQAAVLYEWSYSYK